MIKSIYFNDGKKVKKAQVNELVDLVNKKYPLWVDLISPTLEELNNLKDLFGLHPLAIEDTLNQNQISKIEDYPNHTFLILHSIKMRNSIPEFRELNIFIGQNFLISVHNKEIIELASVKKKLDKSSDIMVNGVDFLLYSLIDIIVDDFFPAMDIIDDKISELETKVFKNPDKSILTKSFKLKHSIIKMRKSISYQREVIHTLSRKGEHMINAKTSIYLRDVYDHLVRINDNLDSYRDILSSVTEAYLSLMSNKMNEVMKVLTVISTIFIPLTFITGLYGMNFKVMPELSHPLGYFIVLGVMFSLGLLMAIYFKKKGWW